MKTFWIIVLVAFLVLFIVAAVRGRHYSGSAYRSRFYNRMPRARHSDPNRQDGIIVAPVIIGATSDSSHAPASAPDCAPGVGDAGGACGGGADGGGAS